MTTNTNAQKNLPTHELFFVDSPAGSEDNSPATWSKVGVAFENRSGNSHTLVIGERGTKQQRYLLVPNSYISEERDSDRRTVAAHIYEIEAGAEIDFKRKDGVAFLNRDDSMSLIFGDRGDPEQVRLQMRAAKTRKPGSSQRTA